ncbi:MAG: nucleotide exchange factor GrpE [Alphaproteobacteria bacterium]|nr:nucleotide exchange factor GrpE [Alphaproteobacteria bacterium]
MTISEQESTPKVNEKEAEPTIEELKDQLLRAMAEVQNTKKRAEKEKADISKFTISGFAKDVLRIRDNLQLALKSDMKDAGAIVDGIKLTMSEMDNILGSYGIKIIESLGKPFDPNFHQAMVEVETEENEPGIVVQVMQEGFMIYDRLLRPALVGVSKKASKNETEAS